MARRYTDLERSEAVAAVIAEGYPEKKGAVSKVSHLTGIPRMTLGRWASESQNPPPPEMVTEAKRDLADKLDTVINGFADELLRRITTGQVKTESLSQISTALGIAFDKLRLLKGESTGNLDVTIKNASDSLDTKLAQLAQSTGQGELYRQPN